MNIFIYQSGKHLHVLNVLQTYSTCSHPGWYDGKIYAALVLTMFLVCPRPLPYPTYTYSEKILTKFKYDF